MTNKSRSQLGSFLAEMMTGIKEILWPRFVLKNSAHICQRSKTWKKVFDVDWNQCMTRPRQHRRRRSSKSKQISKNWKHFSPWQLLPSAYRIEDRGGHAPTAELNCVLGNLFSEENNLGNSFMVKASSAEKMRQNPLVEKSFSWVLPLLSNFSALEIGGCCCCCSSCFKVRRLDERGRNFADCIFAIPLEAGGLFQRNVSKGGQSGFPTNASLVTAALMKLHLVKSNMRRLCTRAAAKVAWRNCKSLR